MGALTSRELSISPSTVQLVRANMLNISTHSWEIGTATEAILELDFPSLSVYGQHPFPPPQPVPGFNTSEVLAIADRVVKNKTAGMLPLIDGDGASGDPASLGPAVLLANWTHFDASVDFATAATEQLDHLLDDVPRTVDGAISQRESEIQLWADFVYMAPPFIANYAALQKNETLLLEAYTQCKLYRQYLSDESTGLWRHILLGSFNDTHLWATGNAWAAAGMLRVLKTIQKSSSAKSLLLEQQNLAQWVSEIVAGAWAFQADNGTLFNYIDAAPTSFPDSSGTALIAASTFRLAALTGDLTYIPAAEKAFNLIKQNISKDGWLMDVVDPLAFDKPGTRSPEGQSFALLLYSARRDFLATHKNG